MARFYRKRTSSFWCLPLVPAALFLILGWSLTGGEDRVFRCRKIFFPVAILMAFFLLWDKKGEQRGLETVQAAFQRLAANPSILADLREVADYQMDVTQCTGHKPYPLPPELNGNYTNNEIQAAFGRVALAIFQLPPCTRTTRLI